MSVSGNKQLSEKEVSEFYQKFMDAAFRAQHRKILGIRYEETPEYKNIERTIIEMHRYERNKKGQDNPSQSD